MDYFFPKEIIWSVNRSLCIKVFFAVLFIWGGGIWKQPEPSTVSVVKAIMVSRYHETLCSYEK